MPSPELVERAADLRAAGDWRAAAALLPATIDVDLAAARDRFGAEATAALEDDLRHLCLDLLCWHLPRQQMRAGNGWSLLHMAMWLDYERVLPPLLAAGVPVDARDNVDRTPLYVGIMNGADPALLRRLLEAGADPRAETVHGVSAAAVVRNYADDRDLKFLFER